MNSLQACVRPIPVVLALSAIVLFGAARAAEPGNQDQVLTTKVGPVDVSLFIPGDVKVLRGLIVHAIGGQAHGDGHWAELCRELQFGLLVTNIDLKQNNRPQKLRAGMDAGLKEFAEKSGHAELPFVPHVGTGHSAGGMVAPMLLSTPETTLTNCTSCSWIADPAKLSPEAARVPALFTLGARPDAFNMLPGIEGNLVPARKQALPWCLGLQWDCAHDFANSRALFIPWIQAVAELRIPRPMPPAGSPVVLKELKEDDGWLGDRATIESNYATIAPAKEFQGDKTQAVWLPNRSVAYVWRAFESKAPAVILQASAADGSAKFSDFRPKGGRQIMIAPGVNVELSASLGEKGFALRKVRFHDGDKLLGEAVSAPWQVTWEKPARGSHAVLAEYEGADGKPGVSRPAVVIVRQAASVAK